MKIVLKPFSFKIEIVLFARFYVVKRAYAYGGEPFRTAVSLPYGVDPTIRAVTLTQPYGLAVMSLFPFFTNSKGMKNSLADNMQT